MSANLTDHDTPLRMPPAFSRTLETRGHRLRRRALTTLQINVGRRCNQACLHCHVGAGPTRTEEMTPATAERLVELLEGPGEEGIHTVDITGGAPELNPSFRTLVEQSRRLGKHVIDRCNLTVLLEPGQEDTARFLAAHGVEIIASMPCYTTENVDRQRGRGVFERSIEALKKLNTLGYGRPDSGLVLRLVYNPGGPFLPAAQCALEADYRTRLREDFGIEFNGLLTLTNAPIRRFRRQLERTGGLEDYMWLLHEGFNDDTIAGLMCRDLLSVSWDGGLFDCDFNQAVDLPVRKKARDIWELSSLRALDGAPIAVGDHCYSCTAGAGSSCGGALAK